MPTRSDVVTEQLDELRTDLQNLWTALTRDPKKEARKARAWTVLAVGLSAAATMLARKAATKAFGILTGEVPPNQRRSR